MVEIYKSLFEEKILLGNLELVGSEIHGSFGSFLSLILNRRKEKIKKLTLVSFAAHITINVCLRSWASLQQTTAVITEKKGSDQRHVCV